MWRGHRLSTGEMEQVLGAHAAVAECAVIGIEDALKGEMPLGLVILKDGWQGDEARLCAELAQRIRQEIGAFASLKEVLIVERLPKTRSRQDTAQDDPPDRRWRGISGALDDR